MADFATAHAEFQRLFAIEQAALNDGKGNGEAVQATSAAWRAMLAVPVPDLAAAIQKVESCRTLLDTLVQREFDAAVSELIHFASGRPQSLEAHHG